MYLQDNDNNFRVIDINEIDLKLINELYNIYRVYPFYFDFFTEKIINNKEIIYFRDSTSIINIDNIEFKNLEILFKILKTFVKKEIIKKIIYKKEFIIIHFNELLHMEYITNYNMITLVPIYVLLKKKLNMNNLYFGVYVNEEYFNEIMMIENNQNKFIVSGDKNNFISSEYAYYKGFKRKRVDKRIDYLDYIEVVFDQKRLIENLEKLMKK